MKIIKSLFQIVFILLFLSACDKEEAVIVLVADAGSDQFVKPLIDIYLDGSKSVGPDGFTYSWKYTGGIAESEINFQRSNTAYPSFTPPQLGLYAFTLTVSSSNLTSEDVVLITVSQGDVLKPIGGTLKEDTKLINIHKDPSIPDYIIAMSDLIIPEGITLSIEKDVLILIGQEKGIIVNGTLSNANNDSYFKDITFRPMLLDSGWKGIQVDGGILNFSGVNIKNAGSNKFENQNEAAAILFSGEPSQIIQFRDNVFEDSFSYDILAKAEVSGYRTIVSNRFSYSIPIKAKMSFMDNFFSDEKNIFPQNYEYIHLITNGIEMGDMLPENRYFEFYHKRYFIDGSFRSKSEIIASGGLTFYIKKNSSLIFENTARFGSSSAISFMKGLNDDAWNGIAAKSGTSLRLKNLVISNSGSTPVVGGSINSNEKAVIYQAGTGGASSVIDITIDGSDGFGIFLDLEEEDFSSFEIVSSHFKNTKEAAIRTNALSIPRTIAKNNSFDLDVDIPGCLIDIDGSLGDLKWPALGNSYYLVDADINFYRLGTIIFPAGLHLKFKKDRFLNWITEGFYDAYLFFKVEGEIDNPVIFEGEKDEPGAWGGLVLEGNFNIDHLEIKNGGAFNLPGASTKANIFFDYKNLSGTDYFKTFTNVKISDSKGYGIAASSDAIDYNFEDPSKNNSFSNNQLGNFIKE